MSNAVDSFSLDNGTLDVAAPPSSSMDKAPGHTMDNPTTDRSVDRDVMVANIGIDDEEEAYAKYVQLVDQQYIIYMQVTTFLYVVKGFDSYQKIGNGSYYHLEARMKGEDNINLSCRCNLGKMGGDCFHKRFYQEFRDSWFQQNEQGPETNGAVVLFLRHMIGMREEIWLNRFLVECRSGSIAARSRSIVTYEGLDTRQGKWSCTKHMAPGTHCTHISRVKKLLQLIIGKWENGDEEGCKEESEPSNMYVVEGVNVGNTTEQSISYLPIMPPSWASLPEDPVLYTRADPNAKVPEVLSLDALSRSACGRHFYDNESSKMEKECTVYTLTGRHHCRIEVQSCPACPRARKCLIAEMHQKTSFGMGLHCCLEDVTYEICLDLQLIDIQVPCSTFGVATQSSNGFLTLQIKADRKVTEQADHEGSSDDTDTPTSTRLQTDFSRCKSELLAVVKELLTAEAPAVAGVLYAVYGANAEQRDWRMCQHYRVLFEQLSANESTMQMVNESGLKVLKQFIESPTQEKASLLVDVPASMTVLQSELQLGKDMKLLILLCDENLENIRSNVEGGNDWRESSPDTNETRISKYTW
uniref:HMG domain-containing protein n=1 Tax=Moniliophthora roreri TaxID=221103 RepID=A0A0W0FFT9_MONRR